tara:strand:+ start:135 stop:1007 length:873 start_codon:yes stop_codon:yes gene_type:complete
MRDILIIGGFNWLGYELVKLFIEKKLFSNVIIVDTLNNFLIKDNKIKNQFDNYAHLYNEDIFLYNINIKDKNELEEIYKLHNIRCVLNNIKFNCDLTEKDKTYLLHGFANIIALNDMYLIEKYVYLARTYTHNQLLFSHRKLLNFFEENFIFNENIYNMNKNKATCIQIPDYIFGNKCYDTSNLIYKMRNIIKTKSPLYIPQCSVVCLCDELLLMLIVESLFSEVDDKYINEVINNNVCGPHRYIDIFQEFKPNNRIIVGEVDKQQFPGINPIQIERTSLFGKYLNSFVL